MTLQSQMFMFFIVHDKIPVNVYSNIQLNIHLIMEAMINALFIPLKMEFFFLSLVSQIFPSESAYFKRHPQKMPSCFLYNV